MQKLENQRDGLCWSLPIVTTESWRPCSDMCGVLIEVRTCKPLPISTPRPFRPWIRMLAPKRRRIVSRPYTASWRLWRSSSISTTPAEGSCFPIVAESDRYRFAEESGPGTSAPLFFCGMRHPARTGHVWLAKQRGRGRVATYSYADPKLASLAFIVKQTLVPSIL